MMRIVANSHGHVIAAARERKGKPSIFMKFHVFHGWVYLTQRETQSLVRFWGECPRATFVLRTDGRENRRNRILRIFFDSFGNLLPLVSASTSLWQGWLLASPEEAVWCCRVDVREGKVAVGRRVDARAVVPRSRRAYSPCELPYSALALVILMASAVPSKTSAAPSVAKSGAMGLLGPPVAAPSTVAVQPARPPRV